MPAMIASGKFHGGMTGADAERDIFKSVLFTRIRRYRLFAAPTQHLAAVKLAKIDRFGRVAIGLGPCF